jgi:hypothetical protein
LPKECETEKKENTAFLSENALRACSMELAGGDLRPDEQSSPPLYGNSEPAQYKKETGRKRPVFFFGRIKDLIG